VLHNQLGRIVGVVGATEDVDGIHAPFDESRVAAEIVASLDSFDALSAQEFFAVMQAQKVRRQLAAHW
jgi:hypothetical protein